MWKWKMLCKSVLNWFTPKYLKKNWKIDKFLLKISQKMLNPLITGTCLIASCKKLENLNNQFLINIKKIHLLTLNPWIKIFFSEFRPCHFFTLLIPTSCKVSQKANERSLRYLKKDGPRTDRPLTDKGGHKGPLGVNLSPKYVNKV